jgi:hypothetical protein
MTVQPRVCANDRCGVAFYPARSTQRFCTVPCGTRARFNAYYARLKVAGRKPRRTNGRRCSVCGDYLVGRQVLYCRERCKARALRWGGNTRPERDAPKCWAWPVILRELERVDQASLPTLAMAVYGDADRASLRAMSDMLRQLANRQHRAPNRPYYRGGPWVELVRRGWWALPGKVRIKPTIGRLALLLRQRPMTVEEAAQSVGVAPRTVYLWLRGIADGGATVERGVAPRWATPDGARWVYRYWIAGSPAADRVAA